MVLLLGLRSAYVDGPKCCCAVRPDASLVGRSFVLAKWEVEFVAAAFGCHCQLVCEHTIYEHTILAGWQFSIN